MGKEKYQKQIGTLFRKSIIVDSSSIFRIINDKKEVKQYHKQLLRNLILKGRIKRLVKGFYTIYDDPTLAVFCFKPSYLGLQDALSLHELWEQETIPVIITANKSRQGIRKVFGTNVLVRKIDKKYLFGFKYFKQGEFYFPYSDIEKTFIDLIYFKQKISEDVRKEIMKKINMKKLKSYLNVYPKKFRERVFGSLYKNA